MNKNFFTTLLAVFVLLAPVAAQENSGFMFPNRFGLSMQKKLGVDVGLISFNQFTDSSPMTFYDISLGVESYVTNPFTLAPKLSFDFGLGDMILFGGGIDVSLPTDFSKHTWMFTPKVGISLASIMRLYYGYNQFGKENGFPNLGNHRVSLEINLAAFHDFGIGL
ncbi:hypothetical protein SAMN05421747_10286 [Parapedobacter composti]|uniref:Outer membrane protein beta-barrel domain-containing protein n=1 Tax=Parapedobacter composti TaxID=623281 RepID=A0A1I1EXH9_9SPHI|nr:hypothetical protein [Parapedobacter composti]SFB91677.1 hypothetical protein SAMN05421747_10286 [Parapedobacter composti]